MQLTRTRSIRISRAKYPRWELFFASRLFIRVRVSHILRSGVVRNSFFCGYLFFYTKNCVNEKVWHTPLTHDEMLEYTTKLAFGISQTGFRSVDFSSAWWLTPDWAINQLFHINWIIVLLTLFLWKLVAESLGDTDVDLYDVCKSIKVHQSGVPIDTVQFNDSLFQTV